MSVRYAPMTLQDYDEAIALWRASEGIGLSAADERPAIAAYLERNPGMSFTARVDGKLAGAVLCSSDGRRGYLHHLAVDPAFRRQDIGAGLARRCLDALARAGIGKCHLFVYGQNLAGRAFWARIGWVERSELVLMSADVPTP